MRLNILHVIPAVAPRYGGPSAAVIGMSRSLAGCGVSSVIVTTDADGPGRLDVECGREVTYAGARVVFFPRRQSESFKWSPPLATWLGRHAADFDVVHVHAVFSHSSLAAARASRQSGVAYVVRPLGTLDPWSLGRHRLRKRVLLMLGLRRSLSEAAALHYTSDTERTRAESALPFLAPGVVVPLGIDEEFFGPAAASSAPYVLAMSRLDPKKGIDVLIDAFHARATNEPATAWRLVIAGDGDPGYVQSLRHRAAAGPASARIEFRGWVAGTERLSLLGGAGLFALPSTQENFGLGLVEALACGVPAVISSSVDLAGDIASSGAGWIADRNPAAIAAVLDRVTAAPAMRAEAGRAARRFAERYRWPVVASALRAMYDGVLSTSPKCRERSLDRVPEVHA